MIVKKVIYLCIALRSHQNIDPESKGTIKIFVGFLHEMVDKGTSINDVRIFEVILNPPPPFVRILFTKPYLLKSEFPEPPLSP